MVETHGSEEIVDAAAGEWCDSSGASMPIVIQPPARFQKDRSVVIERPVDAGLPAKGVTDTTSISVFTNKGHTTQLQPIEIGSREIQFSSAMFV